MNEHEYNNFKNEVGIRINANIESVINTLNSIAVSTNGNEYVINNRILADDKIKDYQDVYDKMKITRSSMLLSDDKGRVYKLDKQLKLIKDKIELINDGINVNDYQTYKIESDLLDIEFELVSPFDDIEYNNLELYEKIDILEQYIIDSDGYISSSMLLSENIEYIIKNCGHVYTTNADLYLVKLMKSIDLTNDKKNIAIEELGKLKL